MNIIQGTGSPLPNPMVFGTSLGSTDTVSTAAVATVTVPHETMEKHVKSVVCVTTFPPFPKTSILNPQLNITSNLTAEAEQVARWMQKTCRATNKQHAFVLHIVGYLQTKESFTKLHQAKQIPKELRSCWIYLYESLLVYVKTANPSNNFDLSRTLNRISNENTTIAAEPDQKKADLEAELAQAISKHFTLLTSDEAPKVVRQLNESMAKCRNDWLQQLASQCDITQFKNPAPYEGRMRVKIEGRCFASFSQRLTALEAVCAQAWSEIKTFAYARCAVLKSTANKKNAEDTDILFVEDAIVRDVFEDAEAAAVNKAVNMLHPTTAEIQTKQAEQKYQALALDDIAASMQTDAQAAAKEAAQATVRAQDLAKKAGEAMAKAMTLAKEAAEAKAFADAMVTKASQAQALADAQAKKAHRS